MDNKKLKYTKVVFFNGPPGSGKDTATIIARNFLDKKLPTGDVMRLYVEHFKFADPLKQAAHALYGIPYSCEYYEKEKGHKWKGEPQVEFFGKTPRDEYIALSEEFAKSRHGVEVFGRVAARRIALAKQANVFLFSDSGFVPEAVPVIKLVGVDNVHVVELNRPGCTFEGDSRGYIIDKLNTMYGSSLKSVRIPNTGDKMDLRLLVQGIMSKWFKVPLDEYN